MNQRPDASPPTVTYDDQDWARCGLEPTEGAAAAAMGFRPDDIAGLRRSASTELDWPAIESRLTATVASIRARATPRSFDTWTAHGGSMVDAMAWLNAGFNLSAAVQWRRRGFWTPEQAAPWRQQELDPAPAAEWHDGGVDARTARSLIRQRVQGSDLARLVRRGMPSIDAGAWLVAKIPCDGVIDWYTTGLSPEQVTDLREARMLGGERVGDLLRRGVQFAVIVNLAELTGRTWEDLRMAPDVDDIVETIRADGLPGAVTDAPQSRDG